MEDAWAYNWVQILRHRPRSVWLLGALMMGLSAVGMWQLTQDFLPTLSLALAALVAMSVVSIKLLESVRSAVLILGVSSVVLFMLIGLGLLITPSFNSTLAFGWVVILIMLMSNLTHIITTLHREMARGAHQFDAIAEAVRLNSSPILLSNTTTLIGFLMVAWFEPLFLDLALTVLLGWALISLFLLIFLPYVMMNWRLEFRVGNYQDRHGFLFIADFLQKQPKVAKALTALLIVLSLIALGLLALDFSHYHAIVLMLLSSGLLLGLVWQSVRSTLTVLLVSALVVLLAAGVFRIGLQQDLTVFMVGLVIPLGIVLDHFIHFFSRIRRAQQGFYRDNISAIRFTLSSVARPIWNTTVLLLVGLLVLVFGADMMTAQLSLLTMIAVSIASFVVLVLLPALYLRAKA